MPNSQRKTSNKKQWLTWLLLTVALVTASCNRKTIYHHYEHTPLTGWEKNDTLLFTLTPSVQRAVVQRSIELRISNSYPFRSLCLIVEQTTIPAKGTGTILQRSKSPLRRDTVNCDLIDPEGNIMGKGANLYQYSFRMTDISLNEGDSLRINIRHNMKRETIPGISDIGIRMTAY